MSITGRAFYTNNMKRESETPHHHHQKQSILSLGLPSATVVCAAEILALAEFSNGTWRNDPAAAQELALRSTSRDLEFVTERFWESVSPSVTCSFRPIVIKHLPGVSPEAQQWPRQTRPPASREDGPTDNVQVRWWGQWKESGSRGRTAGGGDHLDQAAFWTEWCLQWCWGTGGRWHITARRGAVVRSEVACMHMPRVACSCKWTRKAPQTSSSPF